MTGQTSSVAAQAIFRAPSSPVRASESRAQPRNDPLMSRRNSETQSPGLITFTTIVSFATGRAAISRAIKTLRTAHGESVRWSMREV